MATAKYEARQIQVRREQKRISVLVFAVKGGHPAQVDISVFRKNVIKCALTALTLEKTKCVGD